MVNGAVAVDGRSHRAGTQSNVGDARRHSPAWVAVLAERSGGCVRHGRPSSRVTPVRHRSATIGGCSGLSSPRLSPPPSAIRLLLAVALGAGLLVGATPADAAEGRTLDEARADLAAAEAKLQRLADQKASAQASVRELQGEQRRIELEVGRLDAEAADHHRALREARRDARLATVEAYVSGNRAVAAVDLDGSIDALWQEAILSDRADAGVEAAIRYRELRTRVEDTVAGLADDADRVAARIRQAETDIDRATRSSDATRRRLPGLRQEIKVLEIVARFGTGRGDPGPAAWAALRNCESHGDYTVNTGNGFYGAYQFDLQTWQSMGGSGLPSDAPPWEQDARAKALYQTRGAQPWPVCGRFL